MRELSPFCRRFLSARPARRRIVLQLLPSFLIMGSVTSFVTPGTPFYQWRSCCPSKSPLLQLTESGNRCAESFMNLSTACSGPTLTSRREAVGARLQSKQQQDEVGSEATASKSEDEAAERNSKETSRVFEDLQYPCDFKVKIVGADEDSFVSDMVGVVADSCKVEADTVEFTERKKGKWTSVTVSAPLQSADMLYELYANIDRDPRVKFKL